VCGAIVLLSWLLILWRCWWGWLGSLRSGVEGGGTCLVLQFASCVVVLVRVVGREGERIALVDDWEQHSDADCPEEALEGAHLSLEALW
jgi:hypothetical protein